MAELPRYRPLGARISSMPSVDFVQTGKAQAQVYNTISDALDKVSEFAFEKAVAQAEREGLQYGYNNPLSEEQINQALKGELDLNDIVQDPGTIFGAASRAGTATQLRVQLEASARNNLAAINAAIEGGEDYNMNQISADIEAMTDGYANVLAQLDPEQAATYSSTINTLAASTYKIGLETAYKKQQTAKIVGATAAIDQAAQEYRNLYRSSTGEMLTYQGQSMLDVDVSSLALTRSLKDVITDTNNMEFIKSNYKKIDEIQANAKSDVIIQFAMSNEFAKNDAEYYSKIRNNDFGRYTGLFNSLNPEQRSAVKVAIREEIKTRRIENEAVEVLKVNDFKSETSAILAELAGYPVGSSQEKAAFERLNVIFSLSNGEAGMQIDSSAYDSLNENRRNPFKETTPRNYDGEFTLRQMIYEGKITTLDDLSNEAEVLGVATQYTINMQGLLDTTVRRAETDVDKLAKRLAGIVPDTIPTAIQKSNYFRVLDRIDEQHEADVAEWEDGGRIGNIPTRLSSGQKLIIEIANSPAQADIEQRLFNLNSKYGKDSPASTDIVFDVYTDYDEIEDALIAAGLDEKTDLPDIKAGLMQIKKLHDGLLD